jgi:plastocyanin
MSCRWSILFACVISSCLVAGCSGEPQPVAGRKPDLSAESRANVAKTSTDTAVQDEKSTAAAAVAAGKADPGWGNLKGRFIYGGDPPEREKIKVTKDENFCGQFDLRDDSLIVEPDGSLANVVVWLRTADISPHEDYAAAADATIELDNAKCQYEPKIALLRVGQTLRIKNTDIVAHNSHVLFQNNKEINPNFVPGGHIDALPKKEERLPVPVKCAIHPWMMASVLVKDTPYMALTVTDGRFEIANLPTGKELEFQAYHVQAGYLSQVTIDGSDPDWKRGRFMIVIQPGDNDLGEVTVDSEAFAN